MSEEQNVQNENNEKNCGCKCFKVLTILALLFSIASLTLSILMFTGVTGNVGGHQQVSAQGKNAISKKYDKGKSLDKALKTGKPVLVFFYTDWCGFCQRFAPTYHKISKLREIKNNVAVAYVNCEDEANKEFVKDYGIQGFPTVYVISTNGTRKQINNGILFQEDAVKAVSKEVLSIIGK